MESSVLILLKKNVPRDTYTFRKYYFLVCISTKFNSFRQRYVLNCLTVSGSDVFKISNECRFVIYQKCLQYSMYLFINFRKFRCSNINSRLFREIQGISVIIQERFKNSISRIRYPEEMTSAVKYRKR